MFIPPTSLEDVRHQRIFAGTCEGLRVQALQQVFQLHGFFGRRDPKRNWLRVVWEILYD